MPNTVTNTRILTSKHMVVQYITIASDGSEETDLVIYDSSAVAAALVPAIADPLDCTILSIYATVSAAAITATVNLEFDAGTDVLALNIPVNTVVKNDFRPIGGLANTSGSNITGDITLTTTGLTSGDSMTIILAVRPN